MSPAAPESPAEGRRSVVIWGASGHARVLRECISQLGYELIALFDNQPGLSSPFPGIPLFVGRDGFRDWLGQRRVESEVHFLVAIGGDRGRDRIGLHEMLQTAGLKPLSVVHPRAFVAATAALQPGCQVLAGAIVCVDAALGRQTIINTRASVDHEGVLGMGVHVASGATLTGLVRVGDYSTIGAGAVVLPRVSIGANTVIGAGSVVTRDIPSNVVAYGAPARVVRMRAQTAA